MPRDLIISNGNLAVAFDHDGILRDFYFPQVGGENHALNHPFRFGVWADGAFTWFPRDWDKQLGYVNSSLVTEVKAANHSLSLELEWNDFVDYQANVLARRIVIRNLLPNPRQVRLFFCQDFRISGVVSGDTAYYHHGSHSIIHYKGKRYFLVSCLKIPPGWTGADRQTSAAAVVPAYKPDQLGPDQFATGEKELPGKQGTWLDAEDGNLSGNPISQGRVDSVLAMHLSLPGSGEAIAYFWIACGEEYAEVQRLHRLVLQETPEEMLRRTASYWKLWADKEEILFADLPQNIVELTRRSLLMMRGSEDNGGAVIASLDSGTDLYLKDTYAYMWPRDGALVVYPFILAGYKEPSQRFFLFCREVMSEDGYFLHKFNPDTSLGSSWHPWYDNGEIQLPIQEDETGLVLWALWEHFTHFRDVEFIRPLYESFILKMANFLATYRDETTGLPLPSYDLWEERRGVFAFTCAAVFAGLIAGARFCRALGDEQEAQRFENEAEGLRAAIRKRLYSDKQGRFLRGLLVANEKPTGEPNDARALIPDETVDASVFALFYFNVFSAKDEAMVSTMESLKDKLWVKTSVGGIARYERDGYHQSVPYSDDVPGNPWLICTTWLAQWEIRRAESLDQLADAVKLLQWVANRGAPSGALPEQVEPTSGRSLSVCPLTWSHSAFVTAVFEYLHHYCCLALQSQPMSEGQPHNLELDRGGSIFVPTRHSPAGQLLESVIKSHAAEA